MLKEGGREATVTESGICGWVVRRGFDFFEK